MAQHSGADIRTELAIPPRFRPDERTVDVAMHFHGTGAANGYEADTDAGPDADAVVQVAELAVMSDAAEPVIEAAAQPQDESPDTETGPEAGADRRATPPVAGRAAPDEDTDVHGMDQDAIGAAYAADDASATTRNNAEVSALANDALPNSLGNVITSNRIVETRQGLEQKRREEAAKMARTALREHLAMLDRQIAELGRRSQAIEDYLAAGDFEVGPDGRLTNAAMEAELQEYERRTGQRVDRNDPVALQAAFDAQNQYILQSQAALIDERRAASELADRIDRTGEPPSVEEMRRFIPDYTAGEMDVARGELGDESNDRLLEGRGYDSRERNRIVDEYASSEASAEELEATLAGGLAFFDAGSPGISEVAADDIVIGEQVGNDGFAPTDLTAHATSDSVARADLTGDPYAGLFEPIETDVAAQEIGTGVAPSADYAGLFEPSENLGAVEVALAGESVAGTRVTIDRNSELAEVLPSVAAIEEAARLFDEPARSGADARTAAAHPSPSMTS